MGDVRNYYDVVVVGAGASGLVAALEASRRGLSTVIIESKPRIGKKILVTGNGKCNFTNEAMEATFYFSDQPAFINEVLSQWGKDELLAFMMEIGIQPMCKNGYYYPRSQQALAVSQALEQAVLEQSIVIQCETKVIDIRVENEKFSVITDSEVVFAKNVIIATGGCATYQKQTEYNGISLAEKLGHRIRPIVPALTGLKAREKYFSSMSGVRTQAKVTLWIDGKEAGQETGEVQFAKYGISGIPVFQLCRIAGKALQNNSNVRATIQLLPEVSKADVMALLQTRKQQFANRETAYLLNGWIPEKIAIAIIKECTDTIHKPIRNISEQELKAIGRMLCDLPATIYDTNGFETAQVMAGGIDTTELLTTMESRLHRHLYFIGEIVDVDGICGGYNLQWAFSTGHIAGINVSK